MKKLITALFLITLTGCASHHKFYDGTKLDESKVAHIQGKENEDKNAIGGGGWTTVQIRGLNGKEIKPENMMANSVEVLPGSYKTEVMVTNQNFYQTAEFQWNAEAGKKYILNYEAGEGHNNVDVLNIKRVWLEDITTGEVITEVTGWSEIKNWVFKSNVTIYI